MFVGLKLAAWTGYRTSEFAINKSIDPSLAHFNGKIVKLVGVSSLAVTTLGNFGVRIASYIALAGASAFGATTAQ